MLLSPGSSVNSRRIGQGQVGRSSFTDGIARLLQREAVYAHRFTGRRYDCGNKLGYLQATVELSLNIRHWARIFEVPQANCSHAR